MRADFQPKQRRRASSGRQPAFWAVTLAVCGFGVFAAYHYGSGTPNVAVPVERVRSGQLAITVEARGELKSGSSIVLTAPQVPDLRIVKLAPAGGMVKKGAVVVEFEQIPPPGSSAPQGAKPELALRAPVDGVVDILPNTRNPPPPGMPPLPFEEGDRAWSGAPIAEIPDLHSMRLEFTLEEVDRGKVRPGAPVTIRVDGISDREFPARIDSINPIADLTAGNLGEPLKRFPTSAVLEKTDPRLRPGMEASASILIRTVSARALIPLRASFFSNGQPAVYLQRGHEFQLHAIEVGERNDKDLVVTQGLNEGDIVALENPVEAAKRARKL